MDMDQSSHQYQEHEFQWTSSAQTRTSQNPVSQEQALESTDGGGIGGDDGTDVKSSARSSIYNSDSDSGSDSDDSDSDLDSNGGDGMNPKISDEEEWKRTQAEWDEQIEDEAGAGGMMDTFLTQVDDRGRLEEHTSELQSPS